MSEQLDQTARANKIDLFGMYILYVILLYD